VQYHLKIFFRYTLDAKKVKINYVDLFSDQMLKLKKIKRNVTGIHFPALLVSEPILPVLEISCTPRTATIVSSGPKQWAAVKIHF